MKGKRLLRQKTASFFVSGYQDSNLGPPAPKAGALTGLRYIPIFVSPLQGAKVILFFYTTKTLRIFRSPYIVTIERLPIYSSFIEIGNYILVDSYLCFHRQASIFSQIVNYILVDGYLYFHRQVSMFLQIGNYIFIDEYLCFYRWVSMFLQISYYTQYIIKKAADRSTAPYYIITINQKHFCCLTRIRTSTNRTKTCCATITPLDNDISKYIH